MARARLVVRPDGRAILALSEPLTERATHELREQIREWETGHWPVLVIPECEVVQVAELHIELEPAAPVPAHRSSW